MKPTIGSPAPDRLGEFTLRPNHSGEHKARPYVRHGSGEHKVRPYVLMGVAGLLGAATGCARPYGVPPFTQLVAESPAGQTASFAAPDEGTVWVDGPGHPGQPRHLIFTGLVHRGETVTIDPSGRQLVVDGKPAAATIDGGKSFYQMWYRPVRHDLLVN